MASKDKKYQLSEGRKKQLEQARRNAKNASKQSKPASNYLGGSTKKTTNTTKKTSGTQSRNNTVSRSTGGKSTVTNRNVRQADKVTGARPYQQSVRGLGNTVGITREGQKQRQDTLPKANAAKRTSGTENTNRTTRTTRGTTMKQASTYLTGGNSSQSKTSSYAAAVRNGNTLPKASDDLRSRISAAQKQKENNLQRAMDTINANSVRWHSASPEEQTRLHNINNRIRQQYGMTYDDKLGNTYLPTASGDKNVSRPVNLMTGAAQPQTEFNSQEEKDARYIELQKEINRLNANYLDPTRKRFGLTDDKKADRDAKKQLVQVLKDEQQAITGGTSRLTQALYSIGNRARAAIPSAYDTAIQHGKNAAKSQENPEYNKLAEQEQTLELQLAGMPSMDADGKVPAEYMEVYNQLQDVRKRKDALTDKTPVDQNKWSQRTLKKAEEQQANATTGLTNGQKYAANTAISLAGNAPTMGLSAIPVVGPYLGAAAMGAQAAGQRMYELNSQGVAPNESFARGLVSGGIEMATEKLPLENLADIIHKGGSGFVKNALRQAGIEATEESASYLANYAADLAANDPNAQFSLEELAQNAAGGAIGGLVFAGMGTGVNTLMTRAEAARNAYISPATQGTPQAPLNTGNGQMLSGAANTQTAPSLADVRQQREALAARDISPKLARAGAETAQTDVQTAPAEVTQPMQGNAQGAALGAQQTAQANDINPTLKKAWVNAESSVGAAQSGFDPYSKMVNDYGAIPEGMNPARMVDVPQSTNGTDRVSNVARTIMESGVTPDSLIPALENHVAEGLFSHDVKSLKKTLSGATKTIQKKGWQGAFDQWEEVTDDRRAVTDDDIALGQMMYTAAVEAGDTQTAMKLAGDLAVQGTALGRGVNAFKLLKKTTPEGQLYYLQKAVQKIQQEYQSRFDKQAGKAAKKQGVPAEDIADQYGLKLNEDLVQEFLNAETDEARTKVVDKIYNDVAQQIPKTAGDRLNAWRYFAMLGNPRTHVRNVMGNVASAIALDASHKVSAAGQKFLPQGQRTRALHTSKEAKQFAKADYANVEAELSGNAYKTEMSEIKQRQKLFPKWMQWGMGKNTRALDVEDSWFKKGSYIKSMGNFLTARGWDVNNLTEAQLNEARQHAIQDAKIATFQDASALADTLSQLEKKNKAWGVALGSLVPFKRTPINVAKRSFELSPVGLLKAITYDAVQVKKGNMDATKMIDHIGQGLTGSGIAALGAFLAAQGVFSAGSSDDDKEANLDAGMGQQEYAINIGGKSYTIDWASPAVVPLAMGGELYEALHQKYDDDETAFNQAMATVSRMFDPMLNMTMLSGIGSTVTSAAYNKSNPLFGIASNVATNFGGQFVPTLFGQVARTVDNTRRTTYADKNSPVPSSVQKFLQRQANKIPGLSQYQPAYTDVWGREQKNGPDNVFARAAYNFFSPGYLADAKSTQTEKALKELYQATGDNSVLPSKPQKYYKTEDGTKKFLTAQEYSALTSEGGKIALDALGKLTKSEAYKGMTNDEKIEAVSDVYKYAKAVAANKTYGKELEGTIQTVKDSGIEPGLYYAYKEMEDSYNDSMETYEARDQVFNAIKNDGSLSDKEKNGLYHTLLIKGVSDSRWKNYTEISDKVTAEEYVDAMIQSQYIKGVADDTLADEKGSDKATMEATEFSQWLDMKGYSAEKRAALEDSFGFYSMNRAKPEKYTFDMIRTAGSATEKDTIGAVENSGISATQYMQIKTLANALKSGVDYEAGKTNAKKEAQAKIVSQNVDNYEQFAAIMSALGRKKFENLYSGGGKLPEDKKGDTGISVNRATGFSNPTKVSDAVITSGYGSRSAPTTNKGKGSKQHDGIDIGGSVNGQAADSIGGGKVTEVGYDGNGYGNYVVVDHGNGYTSLYGHLQKATVKQGDTISAGQQVGVIGSTGNSSGPHLHLRVHKNGQSIDPRTVIPGYGG